MPVTCVRHLGASGLVKFIHDYSPRRKNLPAEPSQLIDSGDFFKNITRDFARTHLTKRDKSMKRCTCVCVPACVQGVEMLLRSLLIEESEHRRRRGWDLLIIPYYLKPSFLTRPQAMSTQDSLPTASTNGPARDADLCDPAALHKET